MIILRSHHPEHPDDGFRSLADDGGLSSANVAHHPAYATVCILSRLPLLQGSLPKNKGTSGNNFSRRTCQRGKKNRSSSKTSIFGKKNATPKIFEKILSKKFVRRRKMKSCKSSETRFAKVSQRSEPCSRGKRSFKVSTMFFLACGGAICFSFRHGTARGGAEAPEKK